MHRKRRKRWHPNWPLLGAISVLMFVCGMYLAVSIAIHAGEDYRVGDLLTPRLLDLFVVVWFFWFGSSIGSFLNVVAWRMPRGRSINGHSGCPFCTARIRAYDNIPVFGWLKLRGRCRACRLPIAARYPIVEAIVGFSIMLVGVFGLYSGGENLPFENMRVRGGGPFRMPQISTEVVAINVYHILMLTGVWALALVRFDGFRLPAGLVRFFLILAVVPMIGWPQLQLVPWQMRTVDGWNIAGHLATFFYVITAIAAACVMGRIVGRYVCPMADPKLDPLGKDTARLIDLILILSVPGVVLGWHALIAISLIAIVAAMFLQRAFPQRNGYAWFVVSIPAATALHLAFWRSLAHWTLWPAPNHQPWVFLAWISLALLLSIDLRGRVAVPLTETHPPNVSEPVPKERIVQ